MRRVTILVLVVALLFCMPGAALAADNVQAAGASDSVVTPMLAYISYATCSLNISSNGYAQMTVVMQCYSPVNKIRLSPHLQRYVNGSWQDVASWSQTTYSDFAMWSKGYYVTSGYQYRLKCYYYCYYDYTLLESVTCTHSDTY